jgi:hypothetical protein
VQHHEIANWSRTQITGSAHSRPLPARTVPIESRGKLREMARLWIDWAGNRAIAGEMSLESADDYQAYTLP